MVEKHDEACRLTIADFRKENYQQYGNVYVHPNIGDLDKSIYRYLRFGHLLSMLRKGVLYLSKRKEFSDLSEKGRKEEGKHIGRVEPVPTNEIEKEIVEEMRKHANLINNSVMNVFISCWTYDLEIPTYNGEKVDENFFMWKAYGSSGVCCRIETTIHDLISSISASTNKVILLSNVNYGVERNPTMDAQREIFWKPLYYQGENEMRLCVLDDSESCGLNLCINPYSMIKSIVMSPFIDPVFSMMIINQLEKRFPKLTKNIRRSHIMEYNA